MLQTKQSGTYKMHGKLCFYTVMRKSLNMSAQQQSNRCIITSVIQTVDSSIIISAPIQQVCFTQGTMSTFQTITDHSNPHFIIQLLPHITTPSLLTRMLNGVTSFSHILRKTTKALMATPVSASSSDKGRRNSNSSFGVSDLSLSSNISRSISESGRASPRASDPYTIVCDPGAT